MLRCCLLAGLWMGLSGCIAGTPRVPEGTALQAYSDEPYAKVLSAVVKGEDGLVDYHAFADDPALERELDVYMNALARFGPDESRGAFPTAEHELAYYLNAYNAAMIRLWLDKGGAEASPTRKVNWLAWFISEGFKIDGGGVTLDHLEQRVIRPRYSDGRIHFALICGALSCPPLLDEPYRAERLGEQMDAIGRAWLNQPDGLRMEGDTAVMSRIMKWYRGDFDEMGGLRGVVDRYAEEPLRSEALRAIDAGRLKFMPYDWTINLAVDEEVGG
ncbi:MAG: DUF547 domain-containing protein [Planctomycetota bacterium]